MWFSAYIAGKESCPYLKKELSNKNDMYKQIFSILIPLVFLSSCKNNQRKDNITTASSDSVRVENVTIKMNPSNGVFTIPCVVNGVKMNFIFDTGASNVCLSLTEALFMYKNGILTDSDIIGKTHSQIADGSIVENTEVILHSIDVGGILITDIKALVSSNLDAPLLLGQSVIKKLGAFEIKGDSLIIKPQNKNYKVLRRSTENPKKNHSIIPPEDKWYDKIAIICGVSNKVDKYLECAKEAIDNDMPELAIKFCNQAISCDSNRWEAYGVKGYIQTQLGDQSIPSLAKYKSKNKHTEDYFFLSGDSLTFNKCIYYLALSYLSQNNPNKAIEIAQELLCKDLNYIPAMDVIAWSYTTLGDYEKAIIWANKMLNLHTEDGIAYFRLANIASSRKNIKEAVKYYEKVIERQDDNSCLGAAYNNLAVIYKNFNFEYALSLYLKAARLGNDDAQKNLESLGIYNW